MQMEAKRTGGLLIVRAEETRLDAAGAIQFKDAFRALLTPEVHHVLLDVSRIEFLDSSGLGALVAILKLMGAERRLDLVGLTPMVDRVFKLTRMDTVFSIHATLDEALAARHGPDYGSAHAN
jgi:anti-sigma B factor antagonist